MESEIDLLRQENARLMAKITELEVENADVKAKYGRGDGRDWPSSRIESRSCC